MLIKPFLLYFLKGPGDLWWWTKRVRLRIFVDQWGQSSHKKTATKTAEFGGRHT
jgi:hypothetical protein